MLLPESKSEMQTGKKDVLSRRRRSTYIQVVQEYERAVIFRLGRILANGARGECVRGRVTFDSDSMFSRSRSILSLTLCGHLQ